MKLLIWLTLFFLAGCGNGAGVATENNVATDNPPAFSNTTTTTPSRENLSKISYPDGITWIGDLAHDSATNTIWFLAGNSIKLDRLIQMDFTGRIINEFPNPIFWLNHGSELTFDGSDLWGTSYGSSNGNAVSTIYRIDPETGTAEPRFACPATTEEWCEGITWDGSGFWSGASDNSTLVKYLPTGEVVDSIAQVTGSTGISDVIFDAADKRLTIVKWNSWIYTLDPVSREISPGRYISPGLRGFRDMQTFWRANNTTKLIETVHIEE